MYRSSTRLLTSVPRAFPRTTGSSARRFLSTAPPTQKSRSWKSSAARWGIAIAGVYYYNSTLTTVFAEDLNQAKPHFLPDTDVEDENLPTLDAIAAGKKQRNARPESSPTGASPLSQAPAAGVLGESNPNNPGIDSPEELEEEANQEGAFNPETGEINWDCPCLGGMAHGPCGEQFRAAFSCFVYSKEDPKGMDCIDKFKGMQDCFRQHPDIYGAELDDDDDAGGDENKGAGGDENKSAEGSPGHKASPTSQEHPDGPGAPVPSLENMNNPTFGKGEKVHEIQHGGPDSQEKVKQKQQRAQEASQQVERDFGEPDAGAKVAPKAAHDESEKGPKKDPSAGDEKDQGKPGGW